MTPTPDKKRKSAASPPDGSAGAAPSAKKAEPEGNRFTVESRSKELAIVKAAKGDSAAGACARKTCPNIFGKVGSGWGQWTFDCRKDGKVWNEVSGNLYKEGEWVEVRGPKLW